jgi:hypothetical protein
METVLLDACILLLEAAWIGGVAAVLSLPYGAATPAALSVGGALLTLVAGAVAGHALLRHAADRRRGGRAVRAGLVLSLGCAWSLALVLATHHGTEDVFSWLRGLPAAAGQPWRRLSPDVLAFGLTLFAWWRGQRTGAQPPDFGAVVRAMGLASLLLAVALLLAAMTAGVPAVAGPAALLLLGAGLPAQALARLREVRRDAATGGDAPAGVERTWLQATAIPVAAVLGVSVAVALLLGDETVRRMLLDAFGLAGALVWSLLYWPLIGIGLVVELLFGLVRLLVPHLTVPRLPLNPPAPGALLPAADPSTAGTAPWSGVVRWVLAGVILLGVAGAFLFTARRAGDAAAPLPGPAAGRESLWSWADVRRAVRRWLGGLLRRRRRPPPATASGAGGEAGGERASAGMRPLYRRFLALGRVSGLPRAPAQTPEEYLAAWRAALPGAAEAGALTGAYERVRYGPPGGSGRPPAGLGQALDRLRRLVVARPAPPA